MRILQRKRKTAAHAGRLFLHETGDLASVAPNARATFELCRAKLRHVAELDIISVMKQSIFRLRAVFGLPDAASDEHEKRVVARYSRGNVKLQLGRVMTEREYRRQREMVLAYDFR